MWDFIVDSSALLAWLAFILLAVVVLSRRYGWLGFAPTASWGAAFTLRGWVAILGAIIVALVLINLLVGSAV